MIEIGRSLKAVRERCAALKGIGPNGKNISFRLATDKDAESAPYPKTVLEVSVAASDTDAAVPFEVTETLTVTPGDDGLDLANRIATALNGVLFVPGDAESAGMAVIHSHRRQRVTASLEPGTRQIVTIVWKGRASWRPRA